MSKSSLEAAAEAAARVNAMLIAKGKLKLPPTQLKPKIGTTINIAGRGTGDLVTAEVEINDAPLSARNLLTRGHTQDEICKYSGAAISTRGRYMNFDDKQKSTSSDRPLYLHIQASTQDAVDSAVSKIHEIIGHHLESGGIAKNIAPLLSMTYPPVANDTIPTTLVNISNSFSSGPLFVQDKVFIGLENAPSNYPVREKVLGPGGIYLQHIRTESGANVTLRGKGSGYIEPTSGREAFEPLHIHLTHPKTEGLQAAKTLALNLVETIYTEFVQWQQQQQQVAAQSLTQPAIGYQTVVPSNIAVSTANVPVSQTVSSSIPISAVLSQGMTLPVATLPNIIQTSISLPVYTGSSIAPIPQVLNTTPGIIASEGHGTIAYPAAYLTSPLPAASVTPTSALLTSPVFTSTTTSNAVSVPLVVSQQIPVLSQAALYTQFSSDVAVSQASVGNLTPAIINNISPITYQYPVNAVTPISQNPTTVYSVPSLPTSPSIMSTVTTSLPPSIISTAYPHLQYQYSKAELKRKFQGDPNANPQQCDQNKLVISTSLQDSAMNPSIHMLNKSSSRKNLEPGADRELMPPPPLLPLVKDPSAENAQNDDDLLEPPKKRLAGALGGLVAYGSEDSDDENNSIGSPLPMKRKSNDLPKVSRKNFSTHNNKYIM